MGLKVLFNGSCCARIYTIHRVAFTVTACMTYETRDERVLLDSESNATAKRFPALRIGFHC